MFEPYFSVMIDINDYQLVVLNDFIRFFLIQLIPQSLFTLTRSNYELFSSIFIETTSYIMISILFYWFVFNKIIIFKNKKNHSIYDYYQNKNSLRYNESI